MGVEDVSVAEGGPEVFEKLSVDDSSGVDELLDGTLDSDVDDETPVSELEGVLDVMLVSVPDGVLEDPEAVDEGVSEAVGQVLVSEADDSVAEDVSEALDGLDTEVMEERVSEALGALLVPEIDDFISEDVIELLGALLEDSNVADEAVLEVLVESLSVDEGVDVNEADEDSEPVGVDDAELDVSKELIEMDHEYDIVDDGVMVSETSGMLLLPLPEVDAEDDSMDGFPSEAVDEGVSEDFVIDGAGDVPSEAVETGEVEDVSSEAVGVYEADVVPSEVVDMYEDVPSEAVEADVSQGKVEYQLSLSEKEDDIEDAPEEVGVEEVELVIPELEDKLMVVSLLQILVELVLEEPEDVLLDTVGSDTEPPVVVDGDMIQEMVE
ncbi:hypothetical protein BDW02DRAFT_626155 [Decorospora gaudefroyi]|uniref:Uncharacterized protein n=1 Tax=Decorospora gaudefroyi TaxID=184978 RepID=A0A6A5KXH2_9PLEO|nr:hypothetical protein BDW02DRAFT_626155 [Decorospora gaudefroyi]